MKKNLSLVRSGLLMACGIVLLALLFSACKKNLNDNNTTPLAALMAFNLSTDQAAVGVSLSGSNLTTAPLGYTSYTGNYQAIYPGSREVVSYDFNTGTPIATATQNFEVNKYYSLFTVGANGMYKNVVVNDNLDSLSATGGQAFVRYVNAIPDSSKPVVTITANGTDIINRNESFGAVSDFKGIAPGDITIKVSNGTNISANRTITLEKSKVYTILLVGIAGNTDPEKLVQIKYISNGTID